MSKPGSSGGGSKLKTESCAEYSRMISTVVWCLTYSNHKTYMEVRSKTIRPICCHSSGIPICIWVRVAYVNTNSLSTANFAFGSGSWESPCQEVCQPATQRSSSQRAGVTRLEYRILSSVLESATVPYTLDGVWFSDLRTDNIRTLTAGVRWVSSVVSREAKTVGNGSQTTSDLREGYCHCPSCDW